MKVGGTTRVLARHAFRYSKDMRVHALQLKLPRWAWIALAGDMAQLLVCRASAIGLLAHLKDGGCDAGVPLLKVEEVVIEDLHEERDRGGVVALEDHRQLLLRRVGDLQRPLQAHHHIVCISHRRLYALCHLIPFLLQSHLTGMQACPDKNSGSP